MNSRPFNQLNDGTQVPRWWRTYNVEFDWTNGVGRRVGRRRSDERCRTGSQGYPRCATCRAEGGTCPTRGPGCAPCSTPSCTARRTACCGTAGRATASRKTSSCKTTSRETANVGPARRAPGGAQRTEAKFCGSSTPPGACGGQSQCSATAAARSARAAHSAPAAACRTPADAGRASEAKRAERTSQDKHAERASQHHPADTAAATTQFASTVAG